MQDTQNEVKRLAQFLGVGIDEKTAQEISENSQFDVMKKKYSDEVIDSLSFKKGQSFFRKGTLSLLCGFIFCSSNNVHLYGY